MKLASILCPTDFTEPSRHAMEHAAAIAHRTGARVRPLHVETAAYADRPAFVGAGPETPPRGTEIVYGNSAADVIAGFAASSDADLIIIGTRGTSGVRQLILGSVTETLLRQARCPVLVVPPGAQSTASFPLKRVLSALDFTAPSIAALRVACGWADDSGADHDVLHVIDEPDDNALFVARPYDVRSHLDAYERRIVERLERAVPRDTCESSRLAYRVARGHAAPEILRLASDTGADLIVLGVARAKAPLFGSTINHVVRNAACPVLTVRS